MNHQEENYLRELLGKPPKMLRLVLVSIMLTLIGGGASGCSLRGEGKYHIIFFDFQKVHKGRLQKKF